MIIVKLKDKRYYNNCKLKFFKDKIVTKEIIDFVKNNLNVFWIDCGTESYNRKDFLNKYKI